MATGSGLFTKQSPEIPHLSKGEVADLRGDIARTLSPLAALTVEEWTNPPAGTAAMLRAAVASTTTPYTITAADLLGPGKTLLLQNPRQLTFTTAGTTPAQVNGGAVIKGKIGLRKQEAYISMQQTAATSTTTAFWTEIESIEFEEGSGTAATVSIGIGNVLYVPRKIKTRAGASAGVLFKEIVNGSVVTTGTLDAISNGYGPASAPNGTNDYAIYYEYDPNVVMP
jgi:hypothetical protein